jgi:hypothetical protein
VLDVAASVEPNVEADDLDSIRTTFTSDDMAVMQEAADFIFEHGLVIELVEMADHVDESSMLEAESASAEIGIDQVHAS